MRTLEEILAAFLEDRDIPGVEEEIRESIAAELDTYLGDDYRNAQKVIIRNGQ